MKRLGQLIADRRTAGVLVALAAAALVLLLGLLAQATPDFSTDQLLPRHDPAVQQWHDTQDLFGQRHRAVVGVETDDVLDAGFLARLARTTDALAATPGVSRVLALPGALVLDPSGTNASPLLGTPATDATARAALRARVLSHHGVVGTLVDATGTATLIHVDLDRDTPALATAAAVREAVTAGLPDARLSWGGPPMEALHLAEATRSDTRRLTPLALALIALLLGLTSRSIAGTAAVLLAAATGAAAALAAGALPGLGSGPLSLGGTLVVLGLGSMPGLQLLLHHQRLAVGLDPAQAAAQTLETRGRWVLVGGLATLAAVGSAAWFDVPALRGLALTTTLGLGVSLGTALAVVPAALVLAGTPGRAIASAGIAPRGWTLAVVNLHLYRPTFAIVLALLVLGGVGFTPRLDTGVGAGARYSDKSPPGALDTLQDTRFGGATQVAIQLRADLSQPAVLDELTLLADRLTRVPHVTAVHHLGERVAQAAWAAGSERRVPDSADGIDRLLAPLSADPGLALLRSDDSEHTLLRVRLDSGNSEELTQALEGIQEALDGVATRLSDLPRDAPGATERLDALYRSRLAALAPRAPRALLDQALALPLVGTPEAPETAQDAARLQALLALVPSASTTARLAGALRSRDATTVGVPDPSGDLRLDWTLTGAPLAQRALSAALVRGALLAAGTALVLLVALFSLVLGGPRPATIALTPGVVTALVATGLLSGVGLALDLGTAVLGPWTLGAVAANGLLLVSHWAAGPFEPIHHGVGRAVARSSRSIWLGAGVGAVACAPLVLGQARPPMVLGPALALALLIGALLAFVAVPVLGNRRRYLADTPVADPADPLFDPGVG